MYTIVFTKGAQEDVVALRKRSPQAFCKLTKLLQELQEHPRTGTGQVEQLKYFAEDTWSHRLDKEHRLVYEIHDTEVLVLVLSAFGHYAK